MKNYYVLIVVVLIQELINHIMKKLKSIKKMLRLILKVLFLISQFEPKNNYYNGNTSYYQ